MGFGDTLAQGLSWIKQKEGDKATETGKFWTEFWEPRRTANMTAVGLVMGPWLHIWYKTLPKLVPRPANLAPGAISWSHIGKQTVVDQAVNGPLLCLYFFTAIGTLEGNSMSQIQDNLRQNYLSTVAKNWGFWGGAMALNFRFLSPTYRVLGVNLSGLAWNSILSWIQFEH